jgi:S1-C subfamily serine protease
MTKKNKDSKKGNPLLIPFIILLVITAYLIGLTTKNQVILPEENNITQKTCDMEKTQEKTERCVVYIKSNLGSGTGVILDNGYIVTNKHVIEGENNFKIVDFNNKELSTKFWNYSEITDLAIFKLNESHEGCELNLENPKKGEDVIAIGYPREIFQTLEASVTKGTISKIAKDEYNNIYIKTDTAINPGNSGGPLINKCGIIGINTLKAAENLKLENVGYAISVITINNQLASLIENGGNKIPPKVNNYSQKFSYYDEIPSQQNVLTQQQINNLISVRNKVNNIRKYWEQYSGGEFDQRMVDQIKDMLARISNITELIFPKIINGETITNEDVKLIENLPNMINELVSYENNLGIKRDDLGYYFYQCKNNTCAKTYGLQKDKCKSSYECIPKLEYHYECRNMTCQRVEGKGENSCYINSDCYHYVCKNKSCVKVEGKGTNECYSDYSCKHNECIDGKCVEVEGPGVNSCFSDYSCK